MILSLLRQPQISPCGPLSLDTLASREILLTTAMDSAAMWTAFGSRYHQQVRRENHIGDQLDGENVVQERLGAIITTMTSTFPTAPSRANTEFQPPYFPPPFSQQSGEMFAHHSQNINDPYSPALHCFQTSQVQPHTFQPQYYLMTKHLRTHSGPGGSEGTTRYGGRCTGGTATVRNFLSAFTTSWSSTRPGPASSTASWAPRSGSSRRSWWGAG